MLTDAQKDDQEADVHGPRDANVATPECKDAMQASEIKPAWRR
ncbi:MAG: hypothetical protein U0359_41490 [Byssovorax sp.]